MYLENRGVAKASLLWKQTKAGDLGAALSPPPPPWVQSEAMVGAQDARKMASFRHFKHLIWSIQKKKFHQNNPNF